MRRSLGYQDKRRNLGPRPFHGPGTGSSGQENERAQEHLPRVRVGLDFDENRFTPILLEKVSSWPSAIPVHISNDQFGPLLWQRSGRWLCRYLPRLQ